MGEDLSSFYEQLFRLRELDPGENTNRPGYFGHLTNDIVYDRIARWSQEVVATLNLMR